MGRIWIVVIVSVVSALFVGYTIGMSVDSEAQPVVEASGHCATPTPEPTPNPRGIYSEWVRKPGSSVGWIRGRDFANYASGAIRLERVQVMTEDEFFAVGKEYGLRWCCLRGKEQYNFAPVTGFPTPYGGAVIKDTWLPARLR